MYRDPKTGIYYVSVSGPGGKRARRSTGTKDAKLAKEIAAKWTHESIRVAKLGELPSWTFDQVMAWWLAEHSAKGRSHYNNLSVVRVLVPYFRGKVISQLTHREVDAFIAARAGEGVGSKTISRNLALFSGALTAAGKSPEFRGIPNPVKGLIPSVSTHDHRLRWEERPVIHSLAQACTDAVMVDYVMTAAYTGMRLSEMVGLEWSRVDFHRDLIHLTPANQKSMRHGVVVISKVARAHLMNRKRVAAEKHPGSTRVFCQEDGSPLTKDGIEYRFEKACKAVGLEDFRVHDLRHCFCTWLALGEVPIQQIKELARHQDFRTTEKYVHLAAAHLRGAVAVLDGQYSVSALSSDVGPERVSA